MLTPREPTPLPTPRDRTPASTPIEPVPVSPAFLPRRLGIFEAAEEGLVLRTRRLQHAWRASRLRRVFVVRLHAGTEMLRHYNVFAALAFAASFILPAVREAGKKKDDGEFEYMLGLAWARTRRRLTLIGIPEVDREGYALEDDLRDAVRCALRSFGFRTPALDELLARIEHEYRATITGVRSSWNSHRLYLMRVLLKTEEEADQIVADTVSEIVRRKLADQHLVV